MQFFAILGAMFAWLLLALVGMPVINVVFGALGGYIVQVFVGGWVVSGADALGVHIDPSRLWQVGAFLAWLGTYVRVPAAPKQPSESK